MAFKAAKRTPPTIVDSSVGRMREYFTPAGIERLIATARKSSRYGHRDATMILIAYRHGLRASELCDCNGIRLSLLPGAFTSAGPSGERPQRASDAGRRDTRSAAATPRASGWATRVRHGARSSAIEDELRSEVAQWKEAVLSEIERELNALVRASCIRVSPPHSKPGPNSAGSQIERRSWPALIWGQRGGMSAAGRS
jgi:hypothetical protein